VIHVSLCLGKSALSLQVRGAGGYTLALGIENRNVIAIITFVVQHKFIAVIMVVASCHRFLIERCFCAGCLSSHLFIKERALDSAFSRGPVIRLGGLSMPEG
jgi:hypothetical protein